MAKKNSTLDQAAGFFLWSFLLSIALLIIWFVFYLVAGDWVYNFHADWFGMTRDEFAMVNYYGLAFAKICAILFFLIPFVAIKIISRKK